MICETGHRTQTRIDYDPKTRIERRYETCACGVRVEVSVPGGFAFPRTADDLMDLGVDPYILEAFGGQVAEISTSKRRASTPRHVSRSRADYDGRPSEEDERWRRNR